MRLGDDRRASATNGHATRATARLHLVRGHLVNRNGHLFWRTAHMRGALTKRPVRSRTVMVSMASNARL